MCVLVGSCLWQGNSKQSWFFPVYAGIACGSYCVWIYGWQVCLNHMYSALWSHIIVHMCLNKAFHRNQGLVQILYSFIIDMYFLINVWLFNVLWSWQTDESELVLLKPTVADKQGLCITQKCETG